jgi:hypothetical protein
MATVSLNSIALLRPGIGALKLTPKSFRSIVVVAKRHTGRSESVRREAVHVEVKGHWARRPTDREVPVDEVSARLLTDSRRRECDVREVLGVEKVGGANLIVSHAKVRVHRGRFDRHAHRRTGKVLVRHDCPAERVEAPVYLAHDQVANYEADVGVSRVEFSTSQR